MTGYEFYLASSLEKPFLNKRVKEEKRRTFDLLKGDKLNLQLIYNIISPDLLIRNRSFKVNIIGDLDYELFNVDQVKCEYLATEFRDRYYLDTKPGLYPDLLSNNNGYIRPLVNQFKALWISINSSDIVGNHKIKIQLEEIVSKANTGIKTATSKIFYEEELDINIVNAKLGDLPIKHTEWFHCDSIANYHKVDVFCEEYWSLLEDYIAFAAKKSDINMLLTPIFTPALDTDIGGERTTVQLVDIFDNDGEYSFNFDRLKRWCSLTKKYGVKYLEISHFFTQWGAKYTPKIVVINNGVEEKRFGWHVESTSKEYRLFLEAFVPQLISELDKFGYKKDDLYFHISDEPGLSHQEDYAKAKKQVRDLLGECKLIDALSEYEIYKNGYVELPVPSNADIEEFAANNIEELWTYYCIAQGDMVPNRFIAQPSYRNRIMGVLMYLYDIKGFLHWGFNFWESENSRETINPFVTTDSNCAFPAGDPFLVYPGPLTSIRNEVQMEAFADLKLLKLVESKIGREETIKIIKEDQICAFTFKDYPRSSEYLLELKEKLINIIK